MTEETKMSEQVKKAVVLLSGGLDSATALGIALAEGYEVYPLSFSYGQRHERELLACRKVIEHYSGLRRLGRDRRVSLDMAIPPHAFFKSALTDERATLPSGGPTGEVPTTYVPMRNTVFLSIAAAYAEVLGAEAIFVGFNQGPLVKPGWRVTGKKEEGGPLEDSYSVHNPTVYPDSRPAYLEAMQRALREGSATNRGLRLEAPLVRCSKAEVLRRAVALGVPYTLTWSCFDNGDTPCGKCAACVLRDAAFKEVFSGE